MPSRPLRTFTVLPHLPERLQGLHQLAYNLWWCWNHDAISLFRRIDEDLFVQLEHSPVKLLAQVGQDRLEQLAHDDGFLAHMDRVVASLDAYLAADTWFQETYAPRTANGDSPPPTPPPSPSAAASPISPPSSACTKASRSTPAASASWPATISRAACDLGIPLVGVGLMYREGYFRQYLNVDGWQQERYPENDFFNLPLIPELRRTATPLAGRASPSAGPRGLRCASGASRSAACRSTCSTPTSRRTTPTTARSPPGSTAATTTCASARKWSSASAASARCAPWARRRPSAT